MIDYLTLQCGNDIPFPEIQLVFHQPTVEEAGLLGESSFWTGVNLLNFSKDKILELQGKTDLNNISNFEILMSVINTKETESLLQKQRMEMVLNLLFPNYQIIMTPSSLILVKDKETHLIDKKNFDIFRGYIQQIFCLDQLSEMGGRDYNPSGHLAKQLAQKFYERRQKLAKMKGQDDGIHILDRYLSILSTGLKISKNTLKKYTIYQLFDEYHRFTLKESYDIWLSAKMAGASGMQDPENWMDDLHEKKKE